MQYLQMSRYLQIAMNISLGKQTDINKGQKKTPTMRNQQKQVINPPAPPAKLPEIQETDSRIQTDPPESLQPSC